MSGAFMRGMANRLACFICGHPCVPTGRHAILIAEWKCQRCGGLYVSHAHYRNVLPADEGSESIFRDAIKASDALRKPPPPGWRPAG